jgi:antitoxin HicB
VDEATIRLHIEPLVEGGYLATSADVPGLVAEGRSITEAVEIVKRLTRKIVESCLENGDSVPPALAKLRKVTLPHHSRSLAEGTLRAILREAGIDVDQFLKA